MGKRGSKQAYDNIFKAFKVVSQNEGYRGLYKGVSASFMRESIYSSLRLGLYEPIKVFGGFYNGVKPTVIRAIMLNATKLSTYDHIKHFIINQQILPDGMACHFVSSVIAGVCIAIVTSPIDLIKTRIMNQPKSKLTSNLPRSTSIHWHGRLFPQAATRRGHYGSLQRIHTAVDALRSFHHNIAHGLGEVKAVLWHEGDLKLLHC